MSNQEAPESPRTQSRSQGADDTAVSGVSKHSARSSLKSATYSGHHIQMADTVDSSIFDPNADPDDTRTSRRSSTSRRRSSLKKPPSGSISTLGASATYTTASLAQKQREERRAKYRDMRDLKEEGSENEAASSKGWDSLMNLEQLRNLNMIDDEEYEMRKAELIYTLTGTVVNSRGKSMIKRIGQSRAGGRNPKKTLGETEISDEIPKWNTIESERAICHEFNPYTEEWTATNRVVKVAIHPFNHGALRYVYYMMDITSDVVPVRDATRSLVKPPPASHVAKTSIDPEEVEESYFLDVVMQKHAQRFADKFNAHDVPKKVGFLDCWVYELIDRTPHVLCGVEEYIEGRYIKYNSNWDWINDRVERNTPQAFSHFTYEASDHKLLVCDLQGVGDLYTDPQMHSHNGEGFGKGNMGKIGMSKFLQSHRCNAICKFLKLPLTNPSDGIDGTVPEQRLMTHNSISTMPHIPTSSSMPESYSSYQNTAGYNAGYLANQNGYGFLPPLIDDASTALLSQSSTKKSAKEGCCRCVIL